MSTGRLAAALRARAAFAAGRNVVAELTGSDPGPDALAIECAYDLQAGSYTAALTDPRMTAIKTAWGRDLADVLRGLGATTVLEAGIGEATTLAFALPHLLPGTAVLGFDLSLSRLLFAARFLAGRGATARLFAADMAQVPLPDAAVDVVVTNHGLEPNGGREASLLAELWRVTRRHLVLIEPDFERGPAEQRERMTLHRYVRDLPAHLATLPGRMLRHEPWPHVTNPLNRPSLIVFEKPPVERAGTAELVSPVGRHRLLRIAGGWACADEGVVYPEILGIPILREEAAVIGYHAAALGGSPPAAPS